MKKSFCPVSSLYPTFPYINLYQTRVSKSVKTVHTNLFANNGKLYKFAITNSNFEKINFFLHASSSIIIKRTCISIFSKIGLVDQSKPCTQFYLQKKCNWNLNFIKIMPFGHKGNTKHCFNTNWRRSVCFFYFCNFVRLCIQILEQAIHT